MKLSKRLELLAYLVEKHKKGNILADIGTDHAYLPCYLIEKNIIDKAYACDVAKGPFAASLSTIRQYHFEENVDADLCEWNLYFCDLYASAFQKLPWCSTGGRSNRIIYTVCTVPVVQCIQLP